MEAEEEDHEQRTVYRPGRGGIKVKVKGKEKYIKYTVNNKIISTFNKFGNFL